MTFAFLAAARRWRQVRPIRPTDCCYSPDTSRWAHARTRFFVREKRHARGQNENIFHVSPLKSEATRRQRICRPPNGILHGPPPPRKSRPLWLSARRSSPLIFSAFRPTEVVRLSAFLVKRLELREAGPCGGVLRHGDIFLQPRSTIAGYVAKRRATSRGVRLWGFAGRCFLVVHLHPSTARTSSHGFQQ